MSALAPVQASAGTTGTDRLAITVVNPPAGGQRLSRASSLGPDADTKEGALSPEHDEERKYNDPKYVPEEDSGPVDRFGGALNISPEEVKLRKKLDIRIITILWMMYFLN